MNQILETFSPKCLNLEQRTDESKGNRETSALTIIYDTSTANYINFHYICRGDLPAWNQ